MSRGDRKPGCENVGKGILGTLHSLHRRLVSFIRMTECQPGCGACCSPVGLGYSQLELYNKPSRVNDDDYDFIMDHLTQITRKQALELNPWLKSARLYQLDINNELTMTSTYYVCDFFDTETRLCMNHENRPPLCRAYPWAGGAPNPELQLPPTCSFRADVGREVTAVPVELRRKSEMALERLIREKGKT